MSRKAWIAVAAVVAAAVALAAVFQVRRSETNIQKKLAPPVKLVLGMGWVPLNANVVLAKQLGFFRDEGLDITLQPHPSGQLAFADLLNGKSDLAMVGGTPLALESLRGARFYVVATTYESDDSTKMVARRDRGIEKPSDLPGKKLGTAFATTSEFVQDSILALHKVDPRSIIRVNLSPAKTVAALLAGEVDAVTIWAPQSLELIKRLGNAAVVFSDKTLYTTTINLVGRDDIVKQHPEVPRRVLAALLRANAFARSDPARAAREVAQGLGLDETVVKADWDPLKLTVALNQSLVVFLEDQARWAIRRRLVEATEVPNILNWIHADALAAVKPEAVNLIR